MTTQHLTMTQMIELAATGLPIVSGSGNLDQRGDALIAATQRLLIKWEVAELDRQAALAEQQERQARARLAAAKESDPELAARVAARRAARNADRKI